MTTQTQDDLPVTGTGVDLDGTAFYVVPSTSEPGRSHIVKQLPTRLVCDCKAACYGRRCAHVHAVVAHKQRMAYEQAEAQMAETVRSLRHTNAVLDELERRETARTAASRGTCTHAGDTALMRRNNRPFSILA